MGRRSPTSSAPSAGSSSAHETLEADDLLGSYARLETEAGGRALLLTGDRDMFQCASDVVRVLYLTTGTRGAVEVGPDEVRERYGIPPELVPDFIALRGDPSDGIPGAKGVGAKTAADLLREHGSLEGVLEHAIREHAARRCARTCSARATTCSRSRTWRRCATPGSSARPTRPRTGQGGAKAAAKRGMNRLAERLEKIALDTACVVCVK